MSNGLHLLVSDNQGIFIPQSFINNYSSVWTGIDPADRTILEHGVEHPEYWDAWNDVLDRAYLMDTEGNKWFLYQDGDLWAICYDLMTDEEYKSFFGEDRE